MTAPVSLTRSDLVPFADLGTDIQESQVNDSECRFVLTRNGAEHTILAKSDHHIVLSCPNLPTQFFKSPALMLAGPTFGDLKNWSQHQAYVSDNPESSLKPISVTGTLKTSGEGASDQTRDGLNIENLDISLTQYRSSMAIDTSLILVVDGPAGSGKTTLIQELARRRANMWQHRLEPLVLHVESRGRVLQNLHDLLAFSLQTLRVTVTYDQVVPLVRHGLVMLAIDGFDELADPTGYQTAWSQLDELVTNTRGQATLIMAGRESFISRSRVESALPAYRREDDQMPLFTIEEVGPQEAKRWLQNCGWTEATFSLPTVKRIFKDEENSYALRPVFLSQFHDLKDDLHEKKQIVSDLLSFLIERMLDREATKFTENSDERQLARIREFLERLLREVARDLAENQANAIPNANLRWIAEFAASDMFSSDFVGTVVNRAESVAFLTSDTRPNHTRFTHEQISIHFLAHECFQSVTDGEVPKYVRRNIFGQETLEGFARAAESLDVDQAGGFVTACRNQLITYRHGDRSRQNLAALAIIVACVVETLTEESLSFDDFDLGEILIPTDAAPIAFSNVTIRTLYARSVDLRPISWRDSTIVTVFADKFTIIGDDIPSPAVVELPNETLRTPQEISAWRHPTVSSLDTGDSSVLDTGDSSVSAGDLDLLRRIDRYRRFWLSEDPDTADRSARKIITNQHWETVRQVLLDHDLIDGNVRASGYHSKFIHFRRSKVKFSENQKVISALQQQ